MSTTIDSLDIQISTSAGQAEVKIQALATALGNLKANSKITVATNGLKRLSEALNELNPALNGMNPAKLQQVRAAMSGLSSLQKLTGLNNAITTLKKIPGVINDLDGANLAKLQLQMTRLSNAIAPLAKEMDKLGTSFAKLPANLTKVITLTNKSAKASKAAASASKDHGNAINSTSLNLMSAIHNFESMVHVANMVIGAVQSTMAEAMEWDGIQYRFGRAFGEDAEEVYNYVVKINEALGINIQQFMQYSSLYGSLLSGFGMAQDKVTTISVGLTELSYDIWAAYNDRFKTLEDASEAVRSAITGEIEPIRNAGIALTEASLQEYMDEVGMATVSIEKLSESQKAEVRYAAMMDAAMNQGIVGTYASEMQTAEGAVRSLTQSYKGLVQAFGSLFIPILQAVIPYLTAFVNLLYDAVAAVAAFFNIPFFKIKWDSGISDGLADAAAGAGGVESALGGAAGAAKKIKDYTMGFDELNIIKPQDESGGGGGGGAGSGVDWGDGLDLETLWDDSVFAKATKQVDELKQKMKEFFEEWKEEIAIIAVALSVLNVASLLGSLGNALELGESFLGVVGTIKKLAGTAIVITLQYSLVSEFLENFIEEGSWQDYIAAMIVTAIGAGALYKGWGKGGLVISLAVTAIASFKAVFDNGGIDSVASAATAISGLASAFGAVRVAIKLLAKTDLGAAVALVREGYSVGAVLGAWFPKAAAIISAAGTWITQTFWPAISSAVTSAIGAIASALGVSYSWAVVIVVVVLTAIIAAIWAAFNWDKVTKFFTETVPEWFSGVKQAVTTWWENFDIRKTIREAMGNAKEWFKGIREDVDEFWNGVIEFIDGIDWKGLGYRVGRKAGKAFKGAKEWFSVAGEKIEEFWEKDLPRFFKEDVPKFFKESIPKVIEEIENSWNKFWKEKVPEFLGQLATFFWIEFPMWKEDMKRLGKDIVSGIWEGIKGAWNEFWKGVKEWIQGFVQGFKDELEINSTSKVFERIGKYIIEGLLSGISKTWENLKKWYNTNVAPKFTLSYWKGVFENVVSGASNKLGEIKGKISSVWDGIKTWFNSNVAPKLTLTYWKDKFNNIVEGIKSKWNEAKNWWNNNKPSLNTVKAVISSVKDSLISAWDTAKKWWNNDRSGLGSISVVVSSIKDKIITAWDDAKDWLDDQAMKLNIKIPEFTVGWNYNISDWQASIANFLFSRKALPYINVKWYAKGGFPDMGEMFIAREAGPELVGKIGNRTTVANNDQIVEAVSRGVYEAVAAAMVGFSGGQPEQAINIYLDGKQITATVEKHQHQRGAALMTGGMAYGY